MPINLLIADDDSLIRESLKILLEMDEDFSVVACAENGLEAFNLCLNNNIDIALLDVRMPVMNGVDAAKKIVENANTKVLILTTFDEDNYIREAIKNGARGYLLKNNTPDKIKNAIKTIHSGNSVIQNDILDKLRVNITKKSSSPDTSRFTERELDVIKEIAEGLSNKQIAAKLYISEGTVKNYITSILQKTKLKHRTQIAIYYLKGK